MGALGFCAAGTHLLSICMCVCRYIIRIHKVKKLDVCLPNVYKYTRKCVHIYMLKLLGKQLAWQEFKTIQSNLGSQTPSFANPKTSNMPDIGYVSMPAEGEPMHACS